MLLAKRQLQPCARRTSSRLRQPSSGALQWVGNGPLQHIRCKSASRPKHITSAYQASRSDPNDDSLSHLHGSRPQSAAPDASEPQRKTPQAALQALISGLAVAALGLCFCQGRAIAATVRPKKTTITTTSQVTAAGSSCTYSSVSPMAAVAAAAPYRHSVGVKEVLQYRAMQLFALPAVGKVLAVIAVALPIVLVGGLLYRKAAGDCSWQEALARTYSVLNNCPGSSVESERNRAADFVLHLVYLAGLFTFAVVLGIITDDIGTHVEKVRRGNHPVIEQKHTVVLNWNQQTLSVLQQIAKARHASGGSMFHLPIVVLADKDKEEMDEQVAEELEGTGLQVFTRSGNPAKPTEQRRASVAAADTVVLMWPSDMSPAAASAQQAAVLAALKTAGGIEGQKIVVQSAGQEVGEYDAVQSAVDLARTTTGSRDVASLTTAGTERMNQIIAQVANQPGLEDVFADLLEYEDREADERGAEFYMIHCPEHLEGRPFLHVRRSYPSSTVVGWISGIDEKLHLNSRDTTIVPPGSQLVFVAGCDANQVALPEPYKVGSPRLGGSRGGHQAPRNIIMLCFNANSAASALKSIMEFSSRGSRVTIICESPDTKALMALRQRGLRVSVVDGNPSSRSVLHSKAVRLQQADSVVICGLEGLEPAEADMQVVASVIQLQKLAAQHKKRKQPLAVVATINSTATEDVLWHTTLGYYAEQKASAAAEAAAAAERQKARGRGAVQTPEAAAAAVQPAVSLHLLRPEELMGGMLTQTAASPQLAAVFSELFAKQIGHEIYLRDPKKSYGLKPNTQVLWKDVAEFARKRKETAIGYCCSAGTDDNLLRGQAEVNLGVHADTVINVRAGDKIVVIATQ